MSETKTLTAEELRILTALRETWMQSATRFTTVKGARRATVSNLIDAGLVKSDPHWSGDGYRLTVDGATAVRRAAERAL